MNVLPNGLPGLPLNAATNPTPETLLSAGSLTDAGPLDAASLDRLPHAGDSFASILDAALAQEAASHEQVTQFMLGEAPSLESVVVGVAKADVALDLVLGLRDRLVSAHQEIMRMQV